MSNMEALRQAAPPPRRDRGRKIVLSSDEEDEVVAIPSANSPPLDPSLERRINIPSANVVVDPRKTERAPHSQPPLYPSYIQRGSHMGNSFFRNESGLKAHDDEITSWLEPAKPSLPPQLGPRSQKTQPAATYREPLIKPRSNSSSLPGTNSIDYNRLFKPTTGAFPSPNRNTVNAIAVPKASAFYRPPPSTAAFSHNHWMMSQVHAQDALQRQNSRDPRTQALLPIPGKNTEEGGEDFTNALNMVQEDANDYQRVTLDQADADMRELLSGAIGDGEEADQADGSNTVEGFASGMSLMPHQVRGVKWMTGRETGKKYGGILADDMGLGKTVQTIAAILRRPRTSTEKQAGYTKATLIITPLSVMDQWVKEISTKTSPGALKVCSYHGPQRGKLAATLHKYDIVVTTYNTLSSEHGATSRPAKGKTQRSTAASPSGSDSDSDGDRFGKTLKKPEKALKPLFQTKWLRVVCDEAQQIKNRNTKAAKAAVALQAKLRWCLTGTPIQNNVEELYSLFLFLRAKPLDDWQLFKERIAQPVKAGRPKLAMKRLHAILKAIMLRRTKDATIDGKPILNLPARLVNIVSCEFDKAERDFYDALEKKQALTFNRFLKAGTAMQNYTSVLTLLLRMRQACCHPSLVTASIATDAAAIENKPADDDNLDGEADELADLLSGIGIAGKIRKCEICLAPLDHPEEKNCTECQDLARKARDMSEVNSDLPPSSAKIRMTLELLRQIQNRADGRQKTIIFSQFTSFLNIVEPYLRKDGFKYVRYDGSMRRDKREQSLEAIRSDPTVKVILISFKAGSTGLNLTSCNNVILLDLWWNPALEDQAYDRAHRLGQKLDCFIYKLTVERSVEDRILTLQGAKRELAKAALSGDSTKNLKLNLQDLMALFRAPPAGSPDDDD